MSTACNSCSFHFGGISIAVGGWEEEEPSRSMAIARIPLSRSSENFRRHVTGGGGVAGRSQIKENGGHSIQ